MNFDISKLGFRSFIILQLLLVIAIVIIGALIVNHNQRTTFHEKQALEDNLNTNIELADKLIFETNAQLSLFKDLLIQGKNTTYYYNILEKYYQEERHILEDFNALEKRYEKSHLGEHNGLGMIVQTIQQTQEEYVALAKHLRKAIGIFNSTDIDAASATDDFIGERDQSLINSLDYTRALIVQKNKEELAHLDGHLAEEQFIVLFITSILTLVVVYILYRYMDNRVTKPIQSMLKMTGKLYQPGQSTNAVPNLEALQKMLLRNINHVEQILNSAGEAIYAVDQNGLCTYANPACAQTMGYGNADLLVGTNMHELIHHHYEDGRLHPVEQCPIDRTTLTSKPAYDDKDVFWHKDGYAIPVEYHSYPIIDKGHAIGSVVTFTDISERKQRERELNQFRNTLDKTLDCVFMFTADTLRFIYVNQGAIDQHGYSYEEMLQMTPYDIKPNLNEKQFRDFIRPMLEGDKDFVFFETVHRHKDGHDIPVEIGLQLARQGGGDDRFVAVVRDISERKKSELELAKYRDHLEELVEERTRELHNAQDELVRKERLATLGQLTATVSHELRNPLGAIRPSLFIIERITESLSNDKLRNAVERVDRNIARCDHIIDELLDFTRITELEVLPVEMDNLIDTVINEQAIPPAINIEREAGLGDETIKIDANRFRRAFINVFENAIHALLRNESTEDYIDNASLQIKSAHNNDRIEISVTDNGYGIPEEVMKKIFEPLFSTKGFGVGLGMPTVKQIMEQHRGGIEIQSTQGQGTTVTLWLPATINKQEEAA